MDSQTIKERIILEDKLELILSELGMHHIKDRGDYVTCGMPDGNRQNSTAIYRDTLNVEAYTRNIKDQYGMSDIISLVTFVNNTYFSQSIKWICDVCGFDYYEKEPLQSGVLSWINEMYRIHKEGSCDEDNEQLEPLEEGILKYFGKYGNPLFYDDGISYKTQWEFGLGYDLQYHMITIPIRDEIGVLVGVKGRLYKSVVDDNESKYFYIQPCAKSKILYGLDKTYQYIKEKNEVIVVEAEKSVLQLWTMGIKNAVAISGHKLSKSQVQKLTHLNVPIVLAFDQGAELGKDGKVDKSYYPSEFDKFLRTQDLYCIFDKDNLLDLKESPSDNPDKWYKLYNNYKFKVR